MSIVYRVSGPPSGLRGRIALEPSKSISNRVLIIQSLCPEKFTIHRLSKSDDTIALSRMLTSDSDTLHSGHAGTSYRFMVARACLGNREVKLDASKQLQRRPIGPLVSALQSLGADISYINKEGFPPLLIKPTPTLGSAVNEIHLKAGVSSQYISALLMIAPSLPKGLIIHMVDDPVSLPYIQMTLDIMKWFGIDHAWDKNTITIHPGHYIAKDYSVEGDWSAASYYYSMVALSSKAEIYIEGLSETSLQGDSIVKDIYIPFGVNSTFDENGVTITKTEHAPHVKEVRYDFSLHPDLAQTIMVTIAGTGTKGIFSGLKTLKIKETDRVTAMQQELARVKVLLEVTDENEEISAIQTGKAKWKDKGKFNTYEDHRMAMAFAPLAVQRPIFIKDPDVVSKSYPGFWKDLASLGFEIEKLKW